VNRSNAPALPSALDWWLLRQVRRRGLLYAAIQFLALITAVGVLSLGVGLVTTAVIEFWQRWRSAAHEANGGRETVD